MNLWTVISVSFVAASLTLLFAAARTTTAAPTSQSAEQTLPLVFTGGHDTDPRDGGRPVILVASALKVPADTFRKVFTGVHPSRSGPPSGDQARQNKQVLMAGLAPLGVTNDRLDEVSNYYRYQPQNGQLWKHVDAAGVAVLKNGAVTAIRITNPGAGYSSIPTVTVAKNPVKLQASVAFTDDLSTNGSIDKIAILGADAATRPAAK